MGLDNFKVDEVGEVSSIRKIENYSISKDEWKFILLHSPATASYLGHGGDKEEIRMWIEILDEILLEGVDGVKVSEDEKEKVEYEREKLAEEL